MPFVLLTPLVVVAAIVALALGVPGRRVLTWAASAAGALVGLSLVSIVGIVVLEGGDDDDQDAQEEAQVRVPVRRVDAHLLPPSEEPFPAPEPVIDHLVDGDTVLLGVDLGRRVTIHQCRGDRVEPGACTSGIPSGTEPSADGVVLVQVHARYTARGDVVDCRAVACVLAAFSEHGRAEATRPIVFGEAPPRPSLHVPHGPVEPGESVAVRLRSLPAGATGAVTLCVPGPRGGSPACGAPAPEVAFRADADGTATVKLPVEPGPVAGSTGRCERRSPCAIGVIDAPVLAPFVPVRFASPSGADVPAERAGIGLAVALLLIGAAVLLVRRSDWTPPGGDPFAGVSLRDDPFADVDLHDDYGYEYLVT